jgi:archaellum component FlaF (FlaF/FlaG flagellin family)
MKAPISFEQFTKNPVAAIAFAALIVIGYLYVDMMNIHEAQLENLESSCVQRIDDHKERIESLETTLVRYEDKLELINEKLLECLGTN